MENGLYYFNQQKSVKYIIGCDIDIPTFMKNEKCSFKHKSVRNGYVSKKYKNIVYKYIGKFGDGFIVASHNKNSTGYVIIEYWTKNK